MSTLFLISVACPDTTGLIAAVTGRLFDLGGNLGEVSFAAAEGMAELKAVCEMPAAVVRGDVEAELSALPALAGARIGVEPLAFPPRPEAPAAVTHRVEIAGADMPGLIARISEAFACYGASIVWLSSRRVHGPGGPQYRLRMAVWVPPDRAAACWATVENTAAELKLACRYEPWDGLGDWFGAA